MRQNKSNTNGGKDASVRSPRWRRAIGEGPFVFIIMAVVGIGTGFMALFLKTAIRWISTLITSHLNPHGPDWSLILFPAIGVLAVVALRKVWLKGPISYGVSVIKNKLAHNDPYISPQICYSPLVGASLTLGFGSSAGAEGPMAFSGAALASAMARRFGVSRRMAMTMMACGAGAGIAAIFESPIGGALFTIEILRTGLGSYGVMLLFVTTLIAGLTATGLHGFSIEIFVTEVVDYDPHLLPWSVLLGLFCGLYSLYYSYNMKLVGRWLSRIGNRWVKGLVSGLAVGCVLLLFPSLYGEGYSVMSKMLNSDFNALTFGTTIDGNVLTPAIVLGVAACILVVKGFVTSLSYNGGGVTGEFAPTLFAGCFAGYVFAAALNLWFGTGLPVAQLAFIGMAGVMAGVIRAPMMAIFIVVEIASAYTLLLPIAITAGISFGVVRLFTADSFFSCRMDRRNGLVCRLRKSGHRQ